MLDVRRALVGRVRTALAPLVVVVERGKEAAVPSGWMPPPEASGGASLVGRKLGFQELHLWAPSQGEVDDLYARLGFADGLVVASMGMARGLIYREVSWSGPIKEEDGNYQGVVRWEVRYVDARARGAVR